MKKGIALLLLLQVSLTVVRSQYTALPQIPAQQFPVTAYGAIADGKTDNTTAIQTALDKARSSGGQVIITKGVFICGPLKLYDKTQLILEKDAVLRLRNDIDTYPAANGKYQNFIQVSGASDIKISGQGTIDGQGAIWWQKYTAKELTIRRPQMLFIENTDRIEIEGITFLNPPNTHLSLKNTSQVYIHDITIQAPANSRNTDGINISTRNCTIERCTINTGDDNIALNFGNKSSGNNFECENILISNCKFGYGHGMSIGSFTAGGLRNLLVTDCTFDGTTSSIRIKSARGRGGIVENLTYNNIDIRNSKWPVFISAYYPKEPDQPQSDSVVAANDKTPAYRHISLKHITITNCTEAIKIWGLAEKPIEDVLFEDVKINATQGATIYNARQVKFINSSIIAQKGEKLKTYQAEVSGL
ncbi:MAG: glycosyl hydrolase family 28 protein [Chitinophagaceae bacterium]